MNGDFFNIPVKMEQQSNKSSLHDNGIAEINFTERSKLFDKNANENPFENYPNESKHTTPDLSFM